MPTVAWDGWFSVVLPGQTGSKRIITKNIALLLIDGSILGSGEDEIGDFTIKGTCTETGMVDFQKHYTESGLDPHRCRGICTEHQISGTWAGPSGGGKFILQQELTKESIEDRCCHAVFKVRSALKEMGYVTTAEMILDPELVQCFNAALDQIRDTNGGISNIMTGVHGTSISAVEEICQLGLTWKWANKWGMYGRGEYFVRPPDGLPKALMFGSGALFICLVELGHPLKVSALAGGGFNSWWSDGSSPIDKSDYNSVVGEANTGYGSEELDSITEYVVYNDAQSLPVAVIRYSEQADSEILGRFVIGDHVQTKCNKHHAHHTKWCRGTVKEVLREEGAVQIQFENGDLKVVDSLHVFLVDAKGEAPPIFTSTHPSDVAFPDHVNSPNISSRKTAGGADDDQPSSFESRCAAHLRAHEEKIRSSSLSALRRSLDMADTVGDNFDHRSYHGSAANPLGNYARHSPARLHMGDIVGGHVFDHRSCFGRSATPPWQYARCSPARQWPMQPYLARNIHDGRCNYHSWQWGQLPGALDPMDLCTYARPRLDRYW